MENTTMPQANQQKVADQVVDMMAESGIKHLYGITGDSLNALTEAISNDGRIKFIHMRHEESGAFAASAEAQLTGHLAACAGSSGPGHVHLINGLYDAQRSNAPVLALASTCASSLFGTEYFQETNPILLFSNCNVYNEMASTPTQVPHMLQAAMQEAIGKGGVGVIGLPADVIGMPEVPSYASPTLLESDRLPQPDPERVKAAAKLINKAETVAIFVGSGAKKCSKMVARLAAKVNAPVATTYKSQLEIMGDNPNYVGPMGDLGSGAAGEAVASAG
ncbi:MAG: ubiquinone-dependent pyruvate dehydrogenase, partial [Muribaculaceae bacterium]|nr:ubiquinone-dependent pyruvate dehydrogenase [Muribaculaceae bacterium]